MAVIQLAGRLAPLIARAGISLGGALGKGRGGQAISKAAEKTSNLLSSKILNPNVSEGVAEAVNAAGTQALMETIGGTIQAGPIAGLGGGIATLGSSALLGKIAGPAAGRTGLRAFAGNPITQEIAGQLAGQAAVNLLGNRSQTIPAQTITPDQQIQAMQLQAQMQGNLLGANTQDLAAALNAGTAISSSAGSLFSGLPSYQVTTFDA